MPLPSDFLLKYGPWALVTGASSGIGAEFSRQLAKAGLSIVLVARGEARLQKMSAELSENYPVRTKVIAADLSTPEGLHTVLAATSTIDIGLLINNAGVDQVGSFFRDSLDQHATLIAVNVSAVTAISHELGRRLADRGRGGIIFVSSILATPAPWYSTYSASKAYISALSVILKEELAPKGVHVLCLEPGVVKTDMSDRALEATDFRKFGFTVQQPEDCVSETLTALYQQKAKVTPGLMNKVSMLVAGLLPEPLRMKLMGLLIGRAIKPELMEYA